MKYTEVLSNSQFTREASHVSVCVFMSLFVSLCVCECHSHFDSCYCITQLVTGCHSFCASILARMSNCA